jgi:hypothetical protein
VFLALSWLSLGKRYSRNASEVLGRENAEEPPKETSETRMLKDTGWNLIAICECETKPDDQLRKLFAERLPVR